MRGAALIFMLGDDGVNADDCAGELVEARQYVLEEVAAEFHRAGCTVRVRRLRLCPASVDTEAAQAVHHQHQPDYQAERITETGNQYPILQYREHQCCAMYQ